MKALTVWQPWGSLIAIGAKPYEFRSWPPPKRIIGHRIAIHAGARPVKPKEVAALIAGLNRSLGLERPALHLDKALPFLQRVQYGLQKPKPDEFKQLQLDVEDASRLLLPLSCIVCTAVVGEPKRGDVCAKEFGYAGNDSDRDGTFNWGWPMLDIQFVPNIPARGAQGLWDWTP